MKRRNLVTTFSDGAEIKIRQSGSVFATKVSANSIAKNFKARDFANNHSRVCGDTSKDIFEPRNICKF